MQSDDDAEHDDWDEDVEGVFMGRRPEKKLRIEDVTEDLIVREALKQEELEKARKKARPKSKADGKSLHELEVEEGGPVKESMVKTALTKRALDRKRKQELGDQPVIPEDEVDLPDDVNAYGRFSSHEFFSHGLSLHGKRVGPSCILHTHVHAHDFFLLMQRSMRSRRSRVRTRAAYVSSPFPSRRTARREGLTRKAITLRRSPKRASVTPGSTPRRPKWYLIRLERHLRLGRGP